MTIMIVGGSRIIEGKADEYLSLHKRLRALLQREGKGLLYWGINRSAQDPHVFGGVAIWATRDDERRMVTHPDRLALVAELKPLIAEKVASVVGPVVMSLGPEENTHARYNPLSTDS